MKLPKQQRQVYDFIKSFTAKNGRSPSGSEIAGHIERSTRMANKVVSDLGRKGLVSRSEKFPFNIVVR